jgi:multiple sugar transport system substrate-binding protein
MLHDAIAPGRINLARLAAAVVTLALLTGVFAHTFGTYEEKPFEGTEITVGLVGEPRSDAIGEFLDEFFELTGITVNLDIQPYPTLQERQAISLTQGQGAFDVVHVDTVWVGQYVENGWVVSAEPYLARTDPDVVDIDDFSPALLEILGMWEGEIYGLPFIQAVQGLYYRTDIFEEHGLEVPQTWEELREVAAYIEENVEGVHGVTWPGRRGVQLQCTYDQMLWSFGGDWYDEEFNATINSPEAIAAVEYLQSLLPYSVPGVLSYDYAETLEAFAQGQAAMNIQWANAAPSLVGSPVDGNWNFTAVPGVERPDGSIERYPTNGGWGLMIAHDARNPDAAWEFIVWATTAEMEYKLAHSGQGKRVSVLQDPELQAQYIEYPGMLEALATSRGRPRIPEYAELADALEVALSEALSGTRTPEAAMNAANQQFEFILRRAGY